MRLKAGEGEISMVGLIRNQTVVYWFGIWSLIILLFVLSACGGDAKMKQYNISPKMTVNPESLYIATIEMEKGDCIIHNPLIVHGSERAIKV